MGVKWSTKIDKLPQMSATTKSINGRQCEVGAASSDAWLASIHEYGCNIPVTPKMRAFFHYQGIHLNPKTTVIKIPERAFLRGAYDKDGERIIKQTERAIGQVIAGKMSMDDLLDLYGQQMATAVKNYMKTTTPNSSLTVQRKGKSTPLVDTGQLLSSITWRKTGI